MDRSGLDISPDSVRQVAVPPAARALSTLSHIDYADAFLLDTGSERDRTPEQWACAVLQDAPVAIRRRLLSGWSRIGLKVDIDRPGRSVLGWEIRSSSREFVLLRADSRIGMPGELLFKPSGKELLFATFVQHNNPLARAIWAAVEPMHVRVVSDILEQAGRRLPAAD